MTTTSYTASSAQFAGPGDLIVSGSSGRVFRVDRVISGVNFACTDEDGKTWKVRRAGARYAPAGTIFSLPEAEAADVTLGTVVLFREGKHADGTKYVVIKCDDEKANLAKLNGNGGYFYRSVPLTRIEVTTAG